MRKRILSRVVPVVALIAACTTLNTTAAAERIKKEKLQIVFCFGQSNMVGLGGVNTAWYLTQPQWIPPRDVMLEKTRFFEWGHFYWAGVRYYVGPDKDKLDALVEERSASRAKWRQRVRGEHGPWKPEWGDKPEGSGRGVMYPYLDRKAEEEGIYRRIAEILDSQDNQLNAETAYNQLPLRDKAIANELARVREIYLKGTKGEDFDAFRAAVGEAVKGGQLALKAEKGVDGFPDAEKQRAAYAALARKHANLPIATRTHIYAHGAVAGSEGKGIQSTTHGPLSVGYGSALNTIGPEYGVGITLERLVDAPILLVKCSWGNTSIANAWLPPSMSADELAWCWKMTMPQIDKVLADPGKYHPEYDPKAGYEVAGLVWFQGYSDMNNPEYSKYLAQLIRDLRKKVKTPDMPVVCGTLGHGAYEQAAFGNEVNKGMLEVSKMPEFAGTVSVVDTAPFFPVEFDYYRQARNSMDPKSEGWKKLSAIVSKATAKGGGTHYHGSAKFFILAGDAMARSLAERMEDSPIEK